MPAAALDRGVIAGGASTVFSQSDIVAREYHLRIEGLENRFCFSGWRTLSGFKARPLLSIFHKDMRAAHAVRAGVRPVKLKISFVEGKVVCPERFELRTTEISKSERRERGLSM
jgi:hypothetical protein